MSIGDYLAVVVVSALVVALLGLLRLYQVKAAPPAERVRKLFHVCTGVLGLTLPWIFDRFVPVLTLAIVALAGFAAIRLSHRFREGMGQVLFAVRRDSFGELCYVLGILLLFWLSKADRILYVVPLLLLAIADTAAALIGQQYGKLRFRPVDGGKSIEGAIAFFFAAFFCVHIPVLLWSGAGRVQSLLISINLSVMTMLAEAAAWWGLDNLIIPLWGYLLLRSQIHMTAEGLFSDLAFVVVLSLVVWLWRNRTTLADDTLCGAILWDYVVWTVGGWQWTLPPLIVLISYETVNRNTALDRLHGFRFPVVLAQIAGAVVWLLMYRQTTNTAVFYPFTSCFAADVAIIGLVRLKSAQPTIGRYKAILLNTAKSLLVIVPSVVAMDGVGSRALLGIMACTVAALASTVLFYQLQPNLADFPVDTARWIRQALVVAAASPIAWLLFWQTTNHADALASL